MSQYERTKIDRRRLRSRLAGIAMAAVGLLGVALAGPASEQAAQGGSRPNVVVVMTDDQTLRSLREMPSVRSLLASEGTTYRNFFVNYPLCCPSRATFLTGQYFHNHRVRSNYRQLQATETLPVWLRRNGYATGLVGKYLNGYGRDRPRYVPPGWTEWYAALGESEQYVYEYELNENGELVGYGSSPSAFKQDVLTSKAVDFVARRAPSAKPFFLYLAYTAPHLTKGPRPQPPADCSRSPQPAPRHADAFDGEPLPKGPSFNEANVSDKPSAVRSLPLLDPGRIALLERRYRCTLASLLSVDEGVEDLVNELELSGELDDTVLLFTSDNGFFFGEHRIPAQKQRVYEEAIHVPLVVRGPGFAADATKARLTANVDLTRTILDVARARPGLTQDGVSLLHGPTGRKALSIETKDVRAMRTRRYLYARYETHERELYDLRRDPHELANVVGRHAYADERERLTGLFDAIRHCAGRDCR